MDPFDSILNKIAVRGTDDAEKNSLLERYRAWLATADPDAARAVAARAAVRFVTSPRGLDGIDEQDTIALATLRCALTACVASIVPGDKVVRDAATEAAAKYDKIVGYIRSGTSNERSYSAGRTGVLVSFAACAACARDDHAEYALRAMYYEPRSTNAVSYAATDQDLFDVEEGSAELFKSSLWQGFEDDLLTGHMISGEYWSDAPKNWAFWEGWYGGMLEGKPLPWDLQRDVALIEDEVWEAGAEAVSEKIAEIEARHRLSTTLQDAQTEIVRSYAQRSGIGGNNPPEAIDDLPPIPKALEVVWEPLADLKDQVGEETPDASVIKSAIQKLTGLIAACGSWTGGKLDAAATEFAKSVGKWGGPAFIAWLTTHVPALERVLVAAKEWLVALLNLA